jgi:hypothetical protein
MNMKIALARNRRRNELPALAAGLVCLGLSIPTAAQAQSPTAPNDHERRAIAEALFDEAKSLMAAERYGEACPKFAESQSVDPAVGTLLNLANCFEKLGRTASAWAEFRAAATAARAKGQYERAEIARRRAAALERVLVRLAIVPPKDSSEKLEIRQNGQIVGRVSWGVALPVDPGRYVIEASVSGKRAFRTEVDVPNKPGTQVTTIIPQLDDGFTAGQLQRGIGIGIGTIGIVSLVAGGALGAQAIRWNSDSATHCNAGNVCDEAGVALRRDAVAFGNASTAAFIIGAAAGVGGIVLYATAPKNPPTTVGFGAIGSGVGLNVGGVF